jgi:hypothetical protein
MKIKAGTPCFISEKREDNKIYPVVALHGKSHFSVDQEVEIKKNWKCENQNLIAVLTKANSVATLVSNDDAKTVVWINKDYI